VFASRSNAQALAAGLPRQDHLSITIGNLFRFHNNEFDEMPCKLDVTDSEYARSNKTQPCIDEFILRFNFFQVFMISPVS